MINFSRLLVGLDFGQASQSVHATNVHSARAANPISARSSERERRVHFTFNLDQRIQHHRATVVQIDLVLLHAGLCARRLRIPPVDCKSLFLFSSEAPCCFFASLSSLLSCATAAQYQRL